MAEMQQRNIDDVDNVDVDDDADIRKGLTFKIRTMPQYVFA